MARAALCAFFGAQGGASRSLPGAGWHHRPHLAGGIRARRAPSRPLPWVLLPAAAERAAPRGGGAAQTGVARGVCTQEQRTLAAPTAFRARWCPGRDALPRSDGGLG